jgi:hypothetical protein
VKIPLTSKADNVRFFLPVEIAPRLADLPWHVPLEEWHGHGVRIIPVKSGLSRHVVRFVEIAGERLAVKQTTLGSAAREHACYRELTRRRIPTLMPVGFVARDDGTGVVETAIGTQTESRVTGFLITRLMEKVVPDSLLFRRGFSTRNRNRIWDAVVHLFVRLHGNGVYWGDASLANMLIHFSAEAVPQLGRKTVLRAMLADAETVETRPFLSDSLRHADVEFFLESMLWTEADLQASGIVRDPLITREDQAYIRSSYDERYAVGLEKRSFELLTHIDVDRLLGEFDAEGHGNLLLRHINEHKWYISERLGRDVGIVEAAEDWYTAIFRPVCGIFNDYGLLEIFPEKTASSLYVEVMEHKYFMSEMEKRDVGLVAALEDYLERFTRTAPLIGSIVRALKALFRDMPAPGNIYLA